MIELPEDKFKSSPGDLSTFMDSWVYQDFQKEITIRIHRLLIELEDGELHRSGRYYDLLRGGIRNLREMQQIFIDIKNAKEDDLERETNEA
jgi:hypothetical protein